MRILVTVLPGQRVLLGGADNILNPEAPLALRLSGQLLLGVVKIYSRKVAFLFDDCNEALVKVTKVNKSLLATLSTGLAWYPGFQARHTITIVQGT